MIVNKHRGEVRAEIDGKTFILCLTLGALAELEAVFEVDDLSALAERFSSGKLSSKDLMSIIGAGLRGGGHLVEDNELALMQIDGGASGWAALVKDLLLATFGHEN